MAPPKISAILLATFAAIESVANSIPSAELQTVVKAACNLGIAITMYLLAEGMILHAQSLRTRKA